MCYYSKRGEEILKKFKYDHTRCASCGREMKEIAKPTQRVLSGISGEHSKSAVIGYQYPTPHSGFAIKEKEGRVDKPGIICKHCGTTNHTDAYFRDDFAKTFLKNLIQYSLDLYHKGRLDDKLDWRNFLNDVKYGHTVKYSLGANL